jgi:hypothetical protein
MKRLQHLLALVYIAVIVSAPTTSKAVAIKEIEEASKEVRRALEGEQVSPESVARLEAALKRGEEIKASLLAEVENLKEERARLMQVQTTLASGLIGAVVTAVVAIGGALLTAKNSRPDRDLKRLDVIEKARKLKLSGVALPDDIETVYVREEKQAE